MMGRWFKIFFFFACIALSIACYSSSYSHTRSEQYPPYSTQIQHKDNGASEALLSDSSLLLHLCSSRPERQISHSLHFKRLISRHNRLLLTQYLLFYRHEGHQLNGNGKFFIVAQRDYYVHTLKHMRC